MARIKYVINERRLAYEGAVKIHEERRQELLEKQARIGAPQSELAGAEAAAVEKLASGGEKENQPETAASDTVVRGCWMRVLMRTQEQRRRGTR